MKKNLLYLSAAAALGLAASCIVSDQLDTLTIDRDGSAQWVKYQSNIRSTEKGEKGAEELKRFLAEFEGRRDADFVRVHQAGGEILDARLVRQQEPYAAVLSAKLPNRKALEDFFTFKDDKGQVVAQARFIADGQRRRFSLTVPVSKDEQKAAASKPTERERRVGQANGLSETRIAVVGGEITASCGFTIADDKRSALLEPSEIQDLVQTATAPVEIFLEWQVLAR